MIGSESYTVTRPYSYLYSGASGTNKTPTTTPPTGGCCLRIEGVGTAGTVKIYGTYGGVVTTETISTFDTDKVGFSYNKWTAITKFDITTFTSVVIYPASSSGEKIRLSTSSTFVLMCDSYDINETQFRGEYIEYGGKTYKTYKAIQYDDRFTLQFDDKVTIDGIDYRIVSIKSDRKGGKLAFGVVWR